MSKVVIVTLFLLGVGCSSTKRDVSMYMQGYTDGWKKGHDYTLDSLKNSQEKKEQKN